MREGLVRDVAVATLAALLTMSWIDGAGAVTTITSCGPLTVFGEVYKVAADLTSCGTCLTVGNNRITINLQGHSITGSCDPSVAPDVVPAGISDGGVARDLTTVRDGSISGFVHGVDLAFSSRSQLLNVESSWNEFYGIRLGLNSLVKGCSATHNGFHGVRVGERSEVRECDASFNGTEENGGDGIFADDHCLITRNTAHNNVEEGIATGGFCTVSFNTASNNGDDGIDVRADGDRDGRHSLVTHNTTNDNGDIGIEVECPSSVTFNTSSGNGRLNYFLVDTPPCQTSGNQ